MDFLKRDLAPITDEAWEHIEQEAVRVLRANLSARCFVDLEGPKGFEHSSVNLGHLDPSDEPYEEGVRYGIRKVLPLTEARVPFVMSIWGLDDLSRGAEVIDNEPLIRACTKLAAFEERAIYEGLPPASITGLSQASVHPSLPLASHAAQYPDTVARALLVLSDSGVGGPYALALGSKPYQALGAEISPYPPRNRIIELLGGPVLHAPTLAGGFLVSLRGGDFRLTLGQDTSIGYENHDAQQVRLYLTETFTFRVLSPEAVIELKAS